MITPKQVERALRKNKRAGKRMARRLIRKEFRETGSTLYYRLDFNLVKLGSIKGYQIESPARCRDSYKITVQHMHEECCTTKCSCPLIPSTYDFKSDRKLN